MTSKKHIKSSFRTFEYFANAMNLHFLSKFSARVLEWREKEMLMLRVTKNCAKLVRPRPSPQQEGAPPDPAGNSRGHMADLQGQGRHLSIKYFFASAARTKSSTQYTINRCSCKA